MTKPLLQIWILSRDRPEFLRQAVASALAQDYPQIEVIVSDNSETDDVRSMMQTRFPQVKCVSRQPTLSALKHFEVILGEACAEFITLFHDDDVLAPGYANTMLRTFNEYATADSEQVVAVSCNAQVLKQNRLEKRFLMGAFDGIRYFRGSKELLLPYMQLGSVGPAPFPSYMYRRKAIEGLTLNPDLGGKYADVSFLAEVAQRGLVIALPQVLMQYRLHLNNDNATEHIGQRLKLVRYMIQHAGFKAHSEAIMHFKFRYWFRWMRSCGSSQKTIHPFRYAVVRKFLLMYGVSLASTRLSVWLRYFNRASK